MRGKRHTRAEWLWSAIVLFGATGFFAAAFLAFVVSATLILVMFQLGG